jgi:GntR family transcriptional regulator, transcriptional repressor for pyruvate dehydrogenase complex
VSEIPIASVKWHRVAESVASHLRDQILSGELQDGDVLPKEDVLRARYPVSKPSLREAMRILETEGLVSIRRGNTGGAVVHRPEAANVAYTLALVLRSKNSGLLEVAKALQECEPVCAALCAARPDRRRAVLPTLRALHRETMADVTDLVSTVNSSRRFHEALVDLCGNEPLKVLVGALEAIWSGQENDWAHNVRDASEVPIVERQDALDVHGELIDLISAGEVDKARELSAQHLAFVQRYPTEVPMVAPRPRVGRKVGAPIDPMLMRLQLNRD